MALLVGGCGAPAEVGELYGNADTRRISQSELTSPEFIAGRSVQLVVSGLAPNTRVRLYASVTGEGITRNRWLDVDLDRAKAMADAVAKADGNAVLTLHIPDDAPSRPWLLQALLKDQRRHRC